MKPTLAPLEQLWHDHARDLHRFLQNRVQTSQDADDLLQEVFLRAVRTPAAQPGPAWLYTVARRVLIDHYRRAVHHRETSVPVLPDAPVPEPEIGERDSCAARCAVAMLGRLPADQAAAVRLADMNAITQRQAARSAGISLSGMKSRVQRGRARLRALVEACCSISLDRRGGIIETAPCSAACGC